MENFPISLYGPDLQEGDQVLAEVLLEAAIEKGSPHLEISPEEIFDRMRAKGWGWKDGVLVRLDS